LWRPFASRQNAYQVLLPRSPAHLQVPGGASFAR
jgi:hypothetical protein